MGKQNQIIITEYNKQALININKNLEFSNWDKNPIQQKIIYEDYSEIGIALNVILDAIETIGFAGNKNDLAICAGLAQIAKKIIPSNELDFLDDLLIKKEKNSGEKIEFTPLNK